jgi:hypothetical protein
MNESNESTPRPLPPQQQVIVESGYTFGQFCLHFCVFIFALVMMTLLGCSMLVGGCNSALQDMADEQKNNSKEAKHGN